MHESFDATILRRADGGQRGEVAPLRREGCRESVLGCLPRGNRAGGDLGDCSQYNARAGRPGIYDARSASSTTPALARLSKVDEAIADLAHHTGTGSDATRKGSGSDCVTGLNRACKAS